MRYLEFDPGHGVCSCSALRKATRRISSLYDVVLAPCGLKQTQHALLEHVERTGGLTLTQLAHELILERSALSRNLKPLERDGLLVVIKNVTDNRMRRVILTPEGSQKLIESRALWLQAHERFERIYGIDKAKFLREMLADIYSEKFAKSFEDNKSVLERF